MTTATDDFNRANETPLAGNWSAGSGDTAFNLASNAAFSPDDSVDRCSIYTGASFGNDQSSKAKLTTSGTSGGGAGPGLCVRHAPAARTFYRLATDHAASTNVEFGRFVAGSFTVLGSFTQAWTNGDTWEFRAVGPAAATVLTIYLNGALVQTFTDNSSLASGSPGISYSTTSISGTIDDWVGTDTFTDALGAWNQRSASMRRKRVVL